MKTAQLLRRPMHACMSPPTALLLPLHLLCLHWKSGYRTFLLSCAALGKLMLFGQVARLHGQLMANSFGTNNAADMVGEGGGEREREGSQMGHVMANMLITFCHGGRRYEILIRNVI